jgi:hypothetical protein
LNEDELKNEIQIILETLRDKNKKEKIDEIISYISEMYGKPNKENVEQWIEKNIKF